MSANQDLQVSGEAAVMQADRSENAKPVTIPIPEEIVRRLKVIAIIRDTTIGELLVEAAAAIVRRDLKKALVRLESA